jgi:magnesium chelatase subunit H
MDTIKSEGEGLGVLLGLVGAEPVRDGQGKIFSYRLIPLEELRRPRIDVLLDVSSVFRDTFQMTLDLLDDLFVARRWRTSRRNKIFCANADAMLAAGRSRGEEATRAFSPRRLDFTARVSTKSSKKSVELHRATHRP